MMAYEAKRMATKDYSFITLFVLQVLNLLRSLSCLQKLRPRKFLGRYTEMCFFDDEGIFKGIIYVTVVFQVVALIPVLVIFMYLFLWASRLVSLYYSSESSKENIVDAYAEIRDEIVDKVVEIQDAIIREVKEKAMDEAEPNRGSIVGAVFKVTADAEGQQESSETASWGELLASRLAFRGVRGA